MTKGIATLRLPELIKWATPALVFVAVLGVLALINRSPHPAGTPESDGDTASLARLPASPGDRRPQLLHPRRRLVRGRARPRPGERDRRDGPGHPGAGPPRLPRWA